MKQERLLQILLEPVVTEKSTYVAEAGNQAVFKVCRDATKSEIKAAVESLFSVRVLDVNVVNLKGKIKRHGRFYGRRNGSRKAYVRLSEDSRIELSVNP
ncbi:MAG: 50S ribosomal protein L23 [Pseudomonadota bacterium]|nr:50S ribosomal protein L23 [Pseudomonadota bacterium]